MKPDIFVRDTLATDMHAIQQIYAQHVLHGLATFELEPPGLAELQRRYAEIRSLGLPYLVAELEGEVVGYGYAAPYRPRPAYRYALEDSVYVREGMAGRGLGRELLAGLIARAEQGQWRQMVAVIGNSENSASIALHESLGFRRVGVFEAVGFKHGRWVDTVLMQRALGEGGLALPGHV